MSEERMKGKELSQKELEEAGWQYSFLLTDRQIVFKKGDRRIFWDPETKMVAREYHYTDQKLTSP